MTPTEAQETEWLFQWAALSCGKHPELKLMYHIPNEGKRSPTAAAKLKAQGLKTGVPDICLPVARGGFHALYIEMKRTSGGKVSADQKRWIEKLTEAGNGYEGTKGSSDYNYGEALQKSVLFYELQRSGDLPEKVRCNWRGDSGLNDGKDAGLDLTGGLYDAGDHVKFNLPMAYTASMLSWSVYEYEDAYKEAGQLDYIRGDIKWITDYLIKCHPEDFVFYYQVGDGNADHSWWGPAEAMTMERPSYKVTRDNPGSCVVGEAAAALASAAVVFAKSDKAYSDLCLTHAKSLFKFANETRSDSGYTAANGFYTSNSGFFDELSWAATWLYIATNEKSYLDTAKECYAKGSQDYIWAMCWDDVHYGTALMLAKLTGEQTYKDAIEKSLDWWTTGTSGGERVKYTPKGLAWLDNWGSLRYATTMGFLASVYASSGKCDAARQKAYIAFAESQCNYALGSTGRSFVVGFGENPPQHPHHRTAQAMQALQGFWRSCIRSITVRRSRTSVLSRR